MEVVVSIQSRCVVGSMRWNIVALLLALSVAGCSDDAPPLTIDAGEEDASLARDAGAAEDAGEEVDAFVARDAGLLLDAGSDSGEAPDAGVDAGLADSGAPLCSGSDTFACGTATCNLHQVCYRYGPGSLLGDVCWDVEAEYRCSPCSTQRAHLDVSPDPSSCPGLTTPSYSGSPEGGCTVTCN